MPSVVALIPERLSLKVNGILARPVRTALLDALPALLERHISFFHLNSVGVLPRLHIQQLLLLQLKLLLLILDFIIVSILLFLLHILALEEIFLVITHELFFLV